MIAKLKGSVDSVFDDSIIISVNGVGYFVFVTARLLSIIKPGDNIEVLTYHVFRQEQQFLCGFQNSYEMVLFKSLLDVPGIGIKSAMAILSVLSPEELAIAIATQNSEAFLRVSGVGKKSAARILLELKDKTALKLKDEAPVDNTDSDNINYAMLGLISLGYQRTQVMNAISNVVRETGNDISTNELIVLCLRELQ